MEREKREGAMSVDMEFARPDKNVCLCAKCKYRKPDGVVQISKERTIIIEQWSNAECEYYVEKPDAIIWAGAECEYFKLDEAIRQ